MPPTWAAAGEKTVKTDGDSVEAERDPARRGLLQEAIDELRRPAAAS